MGNSRVVTPSVAKAQPKGTVRAMHTRILAPVLVMIGLLLTACGAESSSTRTITQSAAASTSTGAPATSSTQPGSETGTSAPDPTTPESSDSTTPPPDEASTQADLDELRKLLTVEDVTATPCVELAGEALPGTGAVMIHVDALDEDITHPGGTLLWTDSYASPVISTDPVEALEEFDVETCTNPHFGVGDAWRWARLPVRGTDLTVLDLNRDWMSFVDIPEEDINDVADGYVVLSSEDELSNEQVLEMNLEWQEKAARLNTLRHRLKLAGMVQDWTSTYTLKPVDNRLTVGGLPEIGVSADPDTRPALVLVIDEKNCGVTLAIGYNLGDKRPENFVQTEVCTPPTTTNPPPSCQNCVPPPPPCTNCTTTTTAPPTTVPGATTTTTTTTTVPEEPCVPPNYRNPSGKCVPPTTVPPSPDTTVAPTTPTTQPGSATTVAAGPGAPNTSVSPTTSTVAPAPPTTATPTTNVPPPADG